MESGRKVYGSLKSPATLKVLAFLFELDLHFEFVPVDLDAGEHKRKPFLSMSPFGEVPVYKDGGLTYFEPRAIIRSMAHQYGKTGEPLIYWDGRKQAAVANWVDVEDHKFEPPALRLISELAIKGSPPDEAAVAEAEAELASVLDVYEAQLKKSKYLAAEKYTIADILHLPNLQSLMRTPAKKLIEARPRVSAWCFNILARPAWAKVLDMQKEGQEHMAGRKLYGSVESTPTMRALASLFEHGLEFEYIPVDVNAGEHQKEPFLSLSPFGSIPVFQDAELVIFESRAIMRSISHVYPKPGKEQIYLSPKMQGIAAIWIDVEDHQFDPPASKLISELVDKPKKGLLPDEEAVAAEEAKLAGVLDVYEERLTESEYLGGDKFTSADLTHLPNLYYLMRTPAKRLFEERPKVRAWCAAITSRPAWTKVLEMVEK